MLYETNFNLILFDYPVDLIKKETIEKSSLFTLIRYLSRSGYHSAHKWITETRFPDFYPTGVSFFE